MSFQASSVSRWVWADAIVSTSSPEVFKGRLNVFIKDLDKTATWHQDENMKLLGSFNFRSLPPCNCSQKILYIHIFNTSPSVSHEYTLEGVRAGCWDNRKMQQAPLYSFLGCYEKGFINIIDLKVLTTCKPMKWNFNCTHLDKVEKYVYASHMILVVTMFSAHTVLIYNEKNVLPYWSSDHS